MRSEKRRCEYWSPEIAVNGLTSPKMERGQRTDNPDDANHRKPKKAVMIVELL